MHGTRCGTPSPGCAPIGRTSSRRASLLLVDWEAAIEPSVREGPALLGFVAARIAEEISGMEAYHAERARQAQWLRERLDLSH